MHVPDERVNEPRKSRLRNGKWRLILNVKVLYEKFGRFSVHANKALTSTRLRGDCANCTALIIWLRAAVGGNPRIPGFRCSTFGSGSLSGVSVAIPFSLRLKTRYPRNVYTTVDTRDFNASYFCSHIQAHRSLRIASKKKKKELNCFPNRLPLDFFPA